MAAANRDLLPLASLPLTTGQDIVLARQAVRKAAQEIGFSLIDETKIVTAASELARNAVVHGQGGSLEWLVVNENGKQGLQLTVSDSGPGIENITLAMKDGWSTGSGLGMGLRGLNGWSTSSKLYPNLGLARPLS